MVYVEGVEGSNDYMMLSSSGKYSRLFSDSEALVLIDDSLGRHATMIGSFCKTSNGYLIQLIGDNKLIYYQNTVGKDILPYEGDYADNLGILEEDIDSAIQEYNSKKSGILNSIIYTDDKRFMFASYNDETVEIYDTNTKELLNTLEDIPSSISVYYGTDKEGNMYIANYLWGYILDGECNLIGEVEYMSGIDPDNEKIFVDINEQRYMFPMYSVKDMIRMGKEIIE